MKPLADQLSSRPQRCILTRSYQIAVLNDVVANDQTLILGACAYIEENGRVRAQF